MEYLSLDMAAAKAGLPPHSVEAEQAVLGAILFDGSAVAQVADILKPEDFYRGPHRHIYSAMLGLFKAGEPVDIVYISEWLRDNEAIDAAGGVPYLMDLAMSVATADAIRYHAEKVRQHSTRRKLQSFAYELAAVAQNNDTNEVLEFAQRGVTEISSGADIAKDPTTEQLVTQALGNIQERLYNPGRLAGIACGFLELDKILGGLRPSKLIILGARPAMGKSGFALNIATNIAIQEKRPVLFYSLEMPPEELMERALISIAESSEHMGKLTDAANQIPDHLRIIDRPNLNTTQLRASIIKNRLALKDLGLVVIDYLQLMKGHGSNRNEEIASISRELKQISREFKVPVLCLAQLSRKVEEREIKRPMKSDLRDSGAIEQDADQILFIYRDEYYNKDSDKKGMAEIIVSKNRGGAEGKVDLFFRSSVVKFISADLPREFRNDGW